MLIAQTPSLLHRGEILHFDEKCKNFLLQKKKSPICMKYMKLETDSNISAFKMQFYIPHLYCFGTSGQLGLRFPICACIHILRPPSLCILNIYLYRFILVPLVPNLPQPQCLQEFALWTKIQDGLDRLTNTPCYIWWTDCPMQKIRPYECGMLTSILWTVVTFRLLKCSFTSRTYTALGRVDSLDLGFLYARVYIYCDHFLIYF